MAEYLLPDVGEGLTEAEIVSWKVKVGDVIAVNDIVVEIETAKSLVELPSPYAGTVTAIHVEEGTTVAVGTPIITVGDPVAPGGGEPGTAPADETTPPAGADMEIDLSNPAASGSAEGESLVGRMKADRGPARRPRKVASGTLATRIQAQAAFETGLGSPLVEAAEPEESVPATSAPVGEPSDVRVLAKPPVRKLAKDLGVDLSTVTGTGPNGSITRADLEGAGSGQRHPKHAAQVGDRETREPIKGVRKMMAGAMTQSAFTAPHVTEWVTIDVTRTMELVERLRKRREFREVKVSPLLVLARACILAMRRTPEVNSFWDDAAGEVVLKHYVNLGIAAATPRGLVVPNVKDAQDLSLLDLAAALNDLTAVAREGRTQPAEMSGGTFTITNVGVFGVDAGTPIINPGESAILCFGAIKKQPWVVDADGEDRIVVREVTTLALSFDHRHIDGEKGSRFLADVAGILEDPASALLF
jgi:pyruvate dehydrogenase E2 component (dihydrolipoamide acetyltransferase)